MMPRKRAKLATFLLLALPVQAQSPLPEGENKKLVEKICLDCHGAENFVTRRLDKEGWEKVIGEMIERGAKGSDDDFDKVVAYLTAKFGKEKTR
jgi:competence protein ComEA